MHKIVTQLGETETHIAAAATNAMDLIQVGDGFAGVVTGSKPSFATGEEMPVVTNAIVDVDAATGTTFAAGAKVELNSSTKLAVAAGAGDFTVGQALTAKVSGTLFVRVRLNAATIAPT
jgi:predicted RecA/RadA family phage recombinase